MTTIENRIMDEERALYGSSDITVLNCRFDGPADGESALKESSNVTVKDSYFNLRYPFWHVHGLNIDSSEMTDKCRAALWYSDNIKINNTDLHGIKALRECSKIEINNSDIISPEFGWSVTDLKMNNTTAESEYFLMRSSNIVLDNFTLKGKYSFQYDSNLTITNSELNTKDAFWHAKNVTVRDSVVKGEYLAWFSDNLTLINCKIIGTQPLCYCTNLKLVNCTMEEADFSFEYSDVEADLKGTVISVKNPKSGTITLDEMPEVIMEDAVYDCSGRVVVRK